MNKPTQTQRRDFLKGTFATIATSAISGCSMLKSTTPRTTLIPPPLKHGDTIAFFSPSTPATNFAVERFARAKAYLHNKGYKLKAGSLTGQRDHYRSGSIEARVAELNQLIRDPNVRCIMSTIGGMVSNAMLPYIDYDALRSDPKIIIGYSDVTAILHGVYAQTGIQTYYGPALVASFGEIGYFVEQTYDYFTNIVSEQYKPHRIKNPDFWTDEYVDWQKQVNEKPKNINKLVTINPGRSQGRLIVGNLNTMSGIFGTPYMPIIEQGDILLVEDSFQDAATTERSYAHLKLAGVFDRIGGLVIGKHEKFNDQGTGLQDYQIAQEVIGKVPFPILAQYDCAHTHPMITLPLGAQVELDATNQSITLL